MQIEQRLSHSIVRWPEKISGADLQQLDKFMIEKFQDQRSQPFVLIHDLSLGQEINAAMRKQISDAQTKNMHIARKCLRGVIIISKSALTRGAVTAISWMSPFEFPVKTAASEAEALAMVISMR